jgi:hypothetical protein
LSYEKQEECDLRRIEAWFGKRGIEAKRLPPRNDRKTPDFELWAGTRPIGFCEVKSLGLGPWDWQNAKLTDDGLFTFSGNYSSQADKTKARIANALVGAADQLAAANVEGDELRIVAIVNRSWDADRLDLEAVLRGEEVRDCLPAYREADNPNKRIGTAKLTLDAVVWLERDGAELLVLNERDCTRAANSRALLVRP